MGDGAGMHVSRGRRTPCPRGPSPGRARTVASRRAGGHDHDRHGLLTLLDSQMQLDREPAARWFPLLGALFAGPRRVLMGAAHRGVDAQVLRDGAPRVGKGLEPG